MANQYSSILVAVDGSKEAEHAFQKSIDIAKRNKGAKLTIVNVVNAHSYEGFDRSMLDRAQQLADELVNDYKAQAKSEGLEDVNAAVEYGSPKTIITNEVADFIDADLIVCGATGLNVVERFITGSVSGAIIRSAKCDVLVTRKPE
ncbi:universal stress protein [Fredinandcohnia onubensis]|jgi:nucleotide-binding universal stress UspA family protein|uniref:universal stress protein n=1 Tax=Fredinandcohnia onubensis TaxID=1571209 RepID=UPI000C0BC0BB|nr:universal stress protein [Fredinandcohnia onubensis]